MAPIKFLFAFVMLMFISACNTMEGVGEDVESVGDEIEDAAD